jgi:hypothetical protein
MRTAAATTVICLAVLAAPTVADAAIWKGKTRQGRMAAVVTGAGGVVARVTIKYRARCDDGKAYRSGVVFLPPLDHASTTAFRDAGVIKWRFKDSGERARGRTSVSGGLRRSGRWTGNFRIRVRITKNGRHVATCRTSRIGWKASPV